MVEAVRVWRGGCLSSLPSDIVRAVDSLSSFDISSAVYAFETYSDARVWMDDGRWKIAFVKFGRWALFGILCL